MTVGLILRVTDDSIREIVSFDYQIFFNLLLPPIILSSGYELHQANFFRNIGTILTFAFAGTFLSAVVIGVVLWLYTRVPIEGLNMDWVDAISVGATLSATDPVTILAIFNSYKVDPKLYTIIFGEAILNDAIAIVIFESAQKAKEGGGHTLGFLGILWGIWIFLRDFFGSLFIGAGVGILAALVLKHTYLRRYPKIESCLVILVAYATYFFSQAIHMSGRGHRRLLHGLRTPANNITRNCVPTLLRNHSQTLRLLQYVETLAAYNQVFLPNAGPAIRELHLHLLGALPLYG